MTENTVVSSDNNQVATDDVLEHQPVNIDSTDVSPKTFTQEQVDSAVSSRLAREAKKTETMQQELDELRTEKAERIKAEEAAELEAAEKNNEQEKANTILKEQAATLERRLVEKQDQIDQIFKKAEHHAIKSEIYAVLGDKYSDLDQVVALMEVQGHLSDIEVKNQDFKETFELSINASKVLEIASENYSRFKKQQAPSITSSDSNVAPVNNNNKNPYTASMSPLERWKLARDKQTN